LKAMLHRLRHGKETTVVRKLEELLESPGQRSREHQEIIAREVNYFQQHRDHLRYSALEKAGAPMGGGAVESLGNQLQRRLRGCGQFWGRPGLTCLLRLSVLVKNHEAASLELVSATNLGTHRRRSVQAAARLANLELYLTLQDLVSAQRRCASAQSDTKRDTQTPVHQVLRRTTHKQDAKDAQAKRPPQRHQRQGRTELGTSTQYHVTPELHGSIGLNGTESPFRMARRIGYPGAFRSKRRSGPLLQTSFLCHACRLSKRDDPSARENADYRYFQYSFLKSLRFGMSRRVHAFILISS
jgi:hypothetical protein